MPIIKIKKDLNNYPTFKNISNHLKYLKLTLKLSNILVHYGRKIQTVRIPIKQHALRTNQSNCKV